MIINSQSKSNIQTRQKENWLANNERSWVRLNNLKTRLLFAATGVYKVILSLIIYARGESS